MKKNNLTNANVGTTENTDKRVNEIIRIQKKRNNFVMIDKTFLEDSRLSFKSKGILAYLLSKPDNWKVIVKDLINNSADGKGAIYSGLKELKKYGYYKKEPVRDEKGVILYWESVIYEAPNCEQTEPLNNNHKKNDPKSPIITPLTDFQEVDNQEMDNPYMDNPFMDNRERNNNHINQHLINQKNHIYSNNIKSIDSENGENNADATPSPSDEIRYDTIDFSNKNDIKSHIDQNFNLNRLNPKYFNRRQELQNIHTVIFETLISKNSHFKISKIDIPAYTVKQSLYNLNSRQIEYVLDSLKKKSNSANPDINNTKPYLLTALFNASQMTFTDIDAIKNDVKDKIDLEHLQTNYPNKSKELQELYQIIIEMLASTKKTVRIAKEDMPIDIVKDTFANLNYLHIEYVLDSLRKNTTQVKSTKSYLQTALFNAPKTINNHYSLDSQNFLSEHLGIEPK